MEPINNIVYLDKLITVGFLLYFTDQTKADRGNMYFLGLNDLKNEGDFRWLDYVDDVSGRARWSNRFEIECLGY